MCEGALLSSCVLPVKNCNGRGAMVRHVVLLLVAISFAVRATSLSTGPHALPVIDAVAPEDEALAAELEEEAARGRKEVEMLRGIIAEQEVRLVEVEQSCGAPENGKAASMRHNLDLSDMSAIPDKEAPHASPRRLPAMPVFVGTEPGPATAQNSTLPPQTSSEETMWFVLSGTAATLMQVGFTCIETGSLPEDQAPAAALRGLVGISTSGVAWWLFGYGFAFGGPYDSQGRLENRFIGTRRFAGSDFTSIWRGGESEYGRQLQMIQPTGVSGSWFMEWSLSAACVAIICGGTAERVGITAHAIIAFIFAGFIYPFATAQLKGQGFIVRLAGDDVGVVDFAGSGFVHLTAGVSVLIACRIAGPRPERFSENHAERRKLLPGNTPLITVGTLLLWCGWNGVVAGASRKLRDRMAAELAAQALVNTTVAAAAGGLVAFFLRAALTMVTRNAIVDARTKMKDELSTERAYTIQIDRSGEGALPMGIVVDHLDHKTLHITAIGADGAIGAWNDENPDKQVGIGDRIIQVNGVSDDSTLIANQCKKREVLQISVKPYIPDLPKSPFTLAVQEEDQQGGTGVQSLGSIGENSTASGGRNSAASGGSGSQKKRSQRKRARRASSQGQGSRLSLSAELVMDYTPEWSWHLVFAERGINASVVSAGIRAGMVSVAAGAGSMYTGNALMVGCVAGFLCEFTAILTVFRKIDDPIDAIGAHGVAGFWGLIAAGLLDFGSDGGGGDGLFHGSSGWSCKTDAAGACLTGIRGNAILSQFLAALVLTIIVLVLGAIVFGGLNLAGILRTRGDGEAHAPEDSDEPVVQPPWKAAARAAKQSGVPRTANDELSRAQARQTAQNRSGSASLNPTSSQASEFQAFQASQGVAPTGFPADAVGTASQGADGRSVPALQLTNA